MKHCGAEETPCPTNQFSRCEGTYMLIDLQKTSSCDFFSSEKELQKCPFHLKLWLISQLRHNNPTLLYLFSCSSALYSTRHLLILCRNKSFSFLSDLTLANYISIKSHCVSASPPWFQGCSLACVVFSLIKEISRLPSNLVVMGTGVTWPEVRQTLDERGLALWRASVPLSQFIWHGCLGNKAVRQEAEWRCKLLFVWITAKELPGLQASRGYAISSQVFRHTMNYLSVCQSVHRPMLY